MFVPCTARRSINNQHYTLKYIIPLFNIQAPTCFGSSLSSSGSGFGGLVVSMLVSGT
jgi:hypothetical protein